MSVPGRRPRIVSLAFRSSAWLKMKHSSFSFLDDIRRVASLDYVPTRQDIMKAHLSLDGMQEYTVTNETDGSIVYRIHVAHLTVRVQATSCVC